MDVQDFLAGLLAFPATCPLLLGMREQGLFSPGFGCNLLASAELGGGVPIFASQQLMDAAEPGWGITSHSSTLPTSETAPAAL